jgi:hypothetical protein
MWTLTTTKSCTPEDVLILGQDNADIVDLYPAGENLMSETLKSVLMSRLSTFRPSDRTELHSAFDSSTTFHVAVDAVKTFVIVWENADWLEAYSIERIGKWIAKYQKRELIDILEIWSKEAPSDARLALLRGLELGCQQRVSEFA